MKRHWERYIVDGTNRSQLISTHNSVRNMNKERLEQEQKNRNAMNGNIGFCGGRGHHPGAYHFGLIDVESSECLRHWVQHLLEAIILPLETGTEVVQVAMVTQELQPNILLVITHHRIQ